MASAASARTERARARKVLPTLGRTADHAAVKKIG
jgi:hypothetical protein